ncbi:MAG TPA: hypothetical protein QF730_08470, partial [Planctomycetota bacterium]|nr:hypothetical protein [Planctomycetota bacterium]
MLNTISLLLIPALGGFTPGEARIEVSRGHARLVCEERISTLLAATGPARARGRSHLELGSLGVASVRWPGDASLRLAGGTACEWGPGPEAERAAAGNGALPGEESGEIRLRVHELTAIDLELRHRVIHLEMPAGWSSRLPRGAYHLSRRGAGPMRFEHLAGEPLTWLGPGGARLLVEPGEVVRLALEPPLRQPVVESFSAWPPPATGHGAWESSSWPWVRERIRASGAVTTAGAASAADAADAASAPVAPGTEAPGTEARGSGGWVLPSAAPGPEEVAHEPVYEVVMPPAAEPAAGLTWIPTWGTATARPEAEMPLDLLVFAEPAVELEPAIEPEPVVQPEPIVEPVPSVEPEPIVEPEPSVEPEPIVEPEPVPSVEPEPSVEPV